MKYHTGPTLPQELAALRQKHGFNSTRTGKLCSAQMASREKLADSAQNPNGTSDQWPRNEPTLGTLVQKFAAMGFGWNRAERELKTRMGSRTVRFLEFTNYPTIHGFRPTLGELSEYPVQEFDGFASSGAIKKLVQQRGLPANFETQRTAMDATGIGYKGFGGVSWLAATEVFQLPGHLEQKLVDIGDAVFLLYDAVAALYGTGDPNVTDVLNHNVPWRINRMVEPGTVDLIRPDIMVSSNPDGSYRLVITELESCPAGHGMTHAMQIGYGLPTTMVDEFVAYLNGRDYVVFATHQWSEYVWDQAAFCAALRERGVNATIVFDAELNDIHANAAKNWRAPKEVPQHLRDKWNPDFFGRLKRHGFDSFVHGWSPSDTMSHENPNAVVFRFGYFDNFSKHALCALRNFQQRGATISNPLQFYLESKSLMATIGVASVRSWIAERSATAVATLDECVAETRILDPRFTDLGELSKDRAFWLTKFAAWDGDNKSWGARSLEFGAQHSVTSWADKLDEMASMDHPVVAQHVINGVRFHVAYAGHDGRTELLLDSRSRLTPFLIRRSGKTVHLGSTITLRSDTLRIHGASDAVEAPVRFTSQSAS